MLMNNASVLHGRIAALIEQSYDLERAAPRTQAREIHGLADAYHAWYAEVMHTFEEAFQDRIFRQRQILSQVEPMVGGPSGTGIALLERLCRNFPRFLAPLQGRMPGRRPFAVRDAVDFHDAVHALLNAFFDDVEVREVVPDRLGARPRGDFLLRAERVAVQPRTVRAGADTEFLAEEVAYDFPYYAAHPSCDALVVLVHDPDRALENARGLERRLTCRHDGLFVHLYVTP
ncbi:hypothetical protein BTM25_47200 [Actinomadura rubteroloni]|uniref:Uncharacterized protein n=1 Tax=Actinomadura rubteroloni TaxID=1926885 RepID=A0A2P4UEU8_9ACTN|nr:hypothetical protein [Actinomadura rubteroloni]POM23565.1 hypothetical protein BTM25_47200 [Actinomadura rubteroloni]